MKKRLMSLLAAVAMLSSFVIPVNAGYTPDNMYYVSDVEIMNANKSGASINISNEWSNSGGYNLHVYDVQGVIGGAYQSLDLKLSKAVEVGKTYTVEFYALNLWNGAVIDALIGWDMSVMSRFNIPTLETVYTKYSVNLTPNSSGDTLKFLLHGTIGDARFDDFALYGDDGINLVLNGGFENTVLKAEYDSVKDSKYPAPVDVVATDGATNGSDDAFVGISDKVYCEGNGSLGIRKAGIGNMQVIIGQTNVGWHQLSFKAKGIYNEAKIMLNWNYRLNGTAGSDGNAIQKETLSDGWTRYYMPIWCGGGGLNVFFEGNAATMIFIDDMSLISVSSPDVMDGTELFGEIGGFNYAIAVTAIENLALDGKKLSWTIPEDFAWDGIDIFVNDILVEECDYDAESCTISGIKNADVITVKTYSMDDNGDKIYNEGVSVTANIPDVEFADSVFDVIDSEGNVITQGITAIQAGKIKVTKSVINNNKGDEYSATLVVALYSGSKLEDVKFISSDIPENGEKTELYTTIDVPGTEYTLKAILWDSLTGMIPLDTPDTL